MPIAHVLGNKDLENLSRKDVVERWVGELENGKQQQQSSFLFPMLFIIYTDSKETTLFCSLQFPNGQSYYSSALAPGWKLTVLDTTDISLSNPEVSSDLSSICCVASSRL
jgi:hypothetical protein